MKLTLIQACLLSSLIVLSSCLESEDTSLVGVPNLNVTFSPLGLQGRIINQMIINEDSVLFVATDNGIYSKDMTVDGQWQSKGAPGLQVNALEILNGGVYIASTTDTENQTFSLYRSENDGEDWNEIETNFGGSVPQAANDFFYDQSNQKLYAVGSYAIGVSEDSGSTWDLIYGEWDALASGMDFIAMNESNGELWVSGQNAIEQFFLLNYDSNEGHWLEWLELLRSPSVGKDIAFHPTDASRVLIGGEHGIIETSNNGASWKKLFEDVEGETRFYFGVEYDKEIPERLYAASWKKDFTNPQPLEVMISHNGGGNWTQFVLDNPTIFGGVTEVLQLKSGDTTYLILGLYKGGVYLAEIKDMAF